MSGPIVGFFVDYVSDAWACAQPLADEANETSPP